MLEIYSDMKHSYIVELKYAKYKDSETRVEDTHFHTFIHHHNLMQPGGADATLHRFRLGIAVGLGHGFTLAMTAQNRFYRPVSEQDTQEGYVDIFLCPMASRRSSSTRVSESLYLAYFSSTM